MATQPHGRLRADDLPYVPVEDPAISGYELVDGELVPVSPSNLPHWQVFLAFVKELDAFVRERKLGAVLGDVWTRLRLPGDPERVRAPDISFVTTEKLAVIRESKKEYVDVVPDLVVEVFSTTNERKARDFHLRLRDYLEAGVPLVWVIYPDERYATVYYPDGSTLSIPEHETLYGEGVLPGFSLRLADLFAAAELPS